MAFRVFRRLRDLLDVDTSTASVGDVLTLDADGETWIPDAAAGGGVTDHGALTGLADNDHPQYALAADTATDAELAAAIAGLSATYQPLDSDLTAIAALSTTAFGRGLLTLANQAALLAAAGAAAASHAHAGEDITSGTVADARIASTIARDSEVTAAISAHEAAGDPHPGYTTAAELAAYAQPLDSDLTAIAALTTTAFGRAFLALADAAATRAALDLEPGTDFPALATFNDHSSRHENGGADEISIAGLDGISTELAAHIADGTDAHDASSISVLDTNGDYTATDVEGVLAEIASQLGGGSEGSGARIRHSTTQSISNNTWTAATYDTEDFDDAAYHAGGAPTRLTVAEAGWYDIKAVVAFANNQTGARGARIRLGGATTIGQVFYAQPPQAADGFQIPIGVSYYLTAGQYVECEVYQNSGGSLNIEGGPGAPFSISRQGGAQGEPGVSGVMDLQYESRSTNTILGVADKGKTIDITATITQTFEADETLGDGWWVILRNATDAGTVIVTLDPAGAETIDGLSTVVMYSGESRLIFCNGAGGNFNSTLLSGGFHRFTADGNFIVPHGITMLTVDAIGGGGSGGGGRGGAAGSLREGGSGGGGGARHQRHLPATQLGNPGDTIAVDVATGGTGGNGGSSADGSPGGVGGTTTFGSHVSAFGGGGGLGGTNATVKSGGGGGGVAEAGQAGQSNAGSRGGGGPPALAQPLPTFGGAGSGSSTNGTTGTPGAEWGGGAGALTQSADGGSIAGGSSVYGGGGGGGGGVIASGNVERAGGAGGGAGTFALTGGGGGGGGSTNGGAGTAGTAGDLRVSGQGGGGGGSQDTGTGGAGGNGGAPGGGGGGGGAGTSVGGRGGDGGIGECRVWYS